MGNQWKRNKGRWILTTTTMTMRMEREKMLDSHTHTHTHTHTLAHTHPHTHSLTHTQQEIEEETDDPNIKKTADPVATDNGEAPPTNKPAPPTTTFRMFKLVVVNSYGTQDIRELASDGSTLRLTCKTHTNTHTLSLFLSHTRTHTHTHTHTHTLTHIHTSSHQPRHMWLVTGPLKPKINATTWTKP